MAALLAEDLEELVPEGLGGGVLFGLVFPIAPKGDGALTDFIPAQWHTQSVADRCCEQDSGVFGPPLQRLAEAREGAPESVPGGYS